jgi:hypothetical protein
MVDEDEILPDVINVALDEVERKESHMTKQEIILRDTINKELAKRGYHLRLAWLDTSNGCRYDYIQPMHEWVNELPKVTFMVERLLFETSRKQFGS